MPVQDRFFDDIQVGETWTGETFELNQQEIIAFGRQFDPQFFHIDPEAAAHGPFGFLIASGWHVACAVMRQFIDAKLEGNTPIVGLGADEIRWLKPVRPGDQLTAHREILETRRSARGDRGVVKAAFWVINQRGEKTMSFTTTTIIPCRPSQG